VTHATACGAAFLFIAFHFVCPLKIGRETANPPMVATKTILRASRQDSQIVNAKDAR
jgi:hypothetical protein